MATRSLVQIKQEILAFAADHGQLQTAKYAKQHELLDGGDVRYPAFYFDYTGARKSRGILAMSFTAWVADLENPEQDNEAEALSDTTLIACDVLSFLDGPARDYALQDGVQLRPFTLQDGDLQAGVTFDFTLNVPFPYDRCIIPTKS